jgi:hypothetical protein
VDHFEWYRRQTAGFTSQLTTLYPEKSSLASELSGHPPVVEGMIMGLKGFEGTKLSYFQLVIN